MRIAIVTPVFNDWESFNHLVHEIDRLLPEWRTRLGTLDVVVFVVDDGSTSVPLQNTFSDLTNIGRVEKIALKLNLGHQRAIAVGLSVVESEDMFDAVVVMDSDGEDDPAYIADLIQKYLQNNSAIVVAQRVERSEGIKFRIFYAAYKFVFRLLTGKEIDFGNYCLIPKKQVCRLVHMSELWSHLAAAITKSRITLSRLPTKRATRYFGSSSMNFNALVVHGLSAAAVFTDIVLVRILTIFSFASVVVVLLSLIVVAIRFLTDQAIPGWATVVIGFSGLLLAQCLVFLVISVFLILASRSSISNPAAQLYLFYILSRDRIL